MERCSNLNAFQYKTWYNETPWSKNKLERRGLIWLTFPHCSLSMKEARTGTQARGKSWSKSHRWVLLTDLLCLAYSACFLIESRTTSPGITSHTMGRALPAWSLIEKMPDSWISWRHFLKGVSFLYDNSSLCQVDRQNQPLQCSWSNLWAD